MFAKQTTSTPQNKEMTHSHLSGALVIEQLQTITHAIEHINLSHCVLDATVMATLVESPFFRGIKTLDLSSCCLTDEAILTLCTWPQHFDQLHTLNLSNNRLTDEAVAILSQARAMRRLEHLDLANNQLTNKSVTAIATTHHLYHLQTLDIRHHESIDDLGITLLFKRVQVHFPNLNTVHLGGCNTSINMRRQLQMVMDMR